jgi:hypothetical protein
MSKQKRKKTKLKRRKRPSERKKKLKRTMKLPLKTLLKLWMLIKRARSSLLILKKMMIRISTSTLSMLVEGLELEITKFLRRPSIKLR